MSQTSYSLTPAIGSEGCIAGSRLEAEIQTARAEAAVLPGRVVYVSESTGDQPPFVSHVALTGDVTGVKMLGISLNDPTLETSAGVDLSYAANAVVPVLRKGRVWMKSEDAVSSVPAAVYARFTVGATADLSVGRVRTDADTGKAVALPGARFMTTCAADGLVLVEFEAQN